MVYFGTLGDGYSLKGSKNKPSRHNYELSRNYDYRDIENTYEGTYDFRGSKKFHLRDHPICKSLFTTCINDTGGIAVVVVIGGKFSEVSDREISSAI